MPLTAPARDDQELLTEKVAASDFDKAQHRLTTLLHSQQAYFHENLTAQRKILVQGDSGLKMEQIEMNELPLPEHSPEVYLTCQKMFTQVSENALLEIDVFILNLLSCMHMQHSTNIYHRSIEKLTVYHQEDKIDTIEISSEFLCPQVEQVKVNQYGNEAIVELRGQKLWFVRSIKLASVVIEDPVQVKEFSVTFKTKTVIPNEKRESEVVVYSYFCCLVQQTLQIEIEVNTII